MRLLLALFFTMTSAFAADPTTVKAALAAETSCANYVRVDQDLLVLGFGPYWTFDGRQHETKPAPLVVVDLTGREARREVRTTTASSDAVVWNGRLFVLTYDGLEERSLPSLEIVALHPTHGENRTLLYKEHATHMELSGDKLLMAHGRLGLAVFDLPSRRLERMVKLVQRQAPLESMAMDVVVREGTAWVLMDSFSLTNPDQKPAFRGLVSLDAATFTLKREWAGIDPGADALASEGDTLLVSYMGFPVWKYSWSEIRGNRLPRPRLHTRFGRAGHPTGKGFLDAGYYHTCFLPWPEYQGDPSPRTRLPLSLDRPTMEF